VADPFADVQQVMALNEANRQMNLSANQAQTGSLYPMAYEGQYLNSHSGTYDYYARSYDPTTGTWLQQDPYRGTLTDPTSQHRYMYELNSPLNYWDEYGYISKVYVRESFEQGVDAGHVLINVDGTYFGLAPVGSNSDTNLQTLTESEFEKLYAGTTWFAYTVNTSVEEDQLIADYWDRYDPNEMTEDIEEFSFFSNNCLQNVKRALTEAGIEDLNFSAPEPLTYNISLQQQYRKDVLFALFNHDHEKAILEFERIEVKRLDEDDTPTTYEFLHNIIRSIVFNF
jgi:RHS repeat-associated protein